MHSAPSFSRRAWPGFIAAACLLGLFWWLALSASLRWSHTSDELPHITSGYAYDRFGDFRMQPENGVLPQRLHGLAPLCLGARFSMEPELWQNSMYWQLGLAFFYQQGNPLDRIVWWARALNALFGVALGAFIFHVARQWYGAGGGLLALLLFCFCPNFLFHSAQATSDLAGVLFLTLAAWTFWWHLARRTPGSGLLAGLVTGLALVAKFSGLLVLPLFAVLVAGDGWWRAGPARRWRRLGANLLHGLAAAVVAGGVIWAFYGFRFNARAEGTPALEVFFWPWRPELMLAGWKGAVISRALSWHLLPEAWLRGLDYVFASEAERPAFLGGEYSSHGWWRFFPTLFLAKTTLALLAASVLAAALALRRLRHGGRNAFQAMLLQWLPLAAVAVVTWAAALHSTLNIGHRHILAVYPVLFIAAGGLATLPRRWLAIPVLLAVLQIGESLAIRPHYLAFFNLAAGGPSRAYRLVVDSSLDWGQDLPALRDWLGKNRRPGEPVYLSYFGSAWPPHYGVRPSGFLPALNVARPRTWAADFKPGLYCISATSLAEVYSTLRGSWRPEWTAEMQDPALASDPDRRAELRFARLCKYLQRRAPEASAGYSILIFRLDAGELRTALEGLVPGG